MTSGQLYIVYNCSNLNKISLSNAMICRIEQKSFQFLFEKLGVRDQSNVNGQAIPRSWCSDGDETSLERGTTRSCLPAERREARPEMLATGVTNSVRYDGARPLTAWCTKRQSLNLILSAIGNQ